MSDNELHTKLITYPKVIHDEFLAVEKATKKDVNSQIREILENDYKDKLYRKQLLSK